MPGDKEEATTAAEGSPAENAPPEDSAAKGAEANTEETAKAQSAATDDKKTEEEEEKEEEKKMKTVVLTGFGGLRMMKMSPQPIVTPADGQVLIKASACGMTFQDLLLRQGITDHPPRTPLLMGSECAGVVEALGPNTTGFAVGDRVIALTKFEAWAEFVAVPAAQVYKLPDSVSFQDGVCLLVHYVTAYILLFDMANLRQGQSLLLHSAAGGVGQAILQLAATVGDVTIYGTASEHKHEDLQNKVTHLFPHNKDYVQEIRKLAPGGLDLVLDCLCGEDTNRGISLLKPLGKYILYGSANIVTGDTKSFLSFAKSWWHVDKVNPVKLCDDNRSIGGFYLRQLLFRQGQHDYVRSVIDKLLKLHAQGKVTPVIDSVWAFEDVGEAMLRLQDRKNVGKVLLDPTKEPMPKKRTESKSEAAAEAAEIVMEGGEGEASQKTDSSEDKGDKKGESDGSDKKTEGKEEKDKKTEGKEEKDKKTEGKEEKDKKTEGKEEKTEGKEEKTEETPAADTQ